MTFLSIARVILNRVRRRRISHSLKRVRVRVRVIFDRRRGPSLRSKDGTITRHTIPISAGFGFRASQRQSPPPVA